MLLRKKIILYMLVIFCKPIYGMVHMLQHAPQSRPAQLFNRLDITLSNYISVQHAVSFIFFMTYVYLGASQALLHYHERLDKINNARYTYTIPELNKELRDQTFTYAKSLREFYKKIPCEQADLLQNTIPYLITKRGHLLHINTQWHENMASNAALRKSMPQIAHHVVMAAGMLWLLRVGISTLNRACVQPLDSILYPTGPTPSTNTYSAQDPLIVLLQTAFMLWQIMHRPQ